MVPSFVKYIFKKNTDAYVLILTSSPVIEVKDSLSKSFSEILMKRIIVNCGYRITEDSYKEIHLEGAREVFVVGNHAQPAHDALNVECVDCICKYLESQQDGLHPESITCVFNDLDTYACLPVRCASWRQLPSRSQMP